jgi:hypothetical protein
MLTQRLYLIKINQPWFSFSYLDQKAIHHQNQLSIVFIGICWPEGCTSSKSVKHCVYWYMLTRRLYLIKISQTLCSLGYVDPKVVPHQNQLSIVFIWDMLTRRLYIIKISHTFCLLWYVNPKVVPHQNQIYRVTRIPLKSGSTYSIFMKTMLDLFWWNLTKYVPPSGQHIWLSTTHNWF